MLLIGPLQPWLAMWPDQQPPHLHTPPYIPLPPPPPPAEWQSAAEQLYDPKPLLLAEQHASAAALAERQRDGGKSVGLADCLEVGGGGEKREDGKGRESFTA